MAAGATMPKKPVEKKLEKLPIRLVKIHERTAAKLDVIASYLRPQMGKLPSLAEALDAAAKDAIDTYYTMALRELQKADKAD